jgi:hypothetical protein
MTGCVVTVRGLLCILPCIGINAVYVVGIAAATAGKCTFHNDWSGQCRLHAHASAIAGNCMHAHRPRRAIAHNSATASVQRGRTRLKSTAWRARTHQSAHGHAAAGIRGANQVPIVYSPLSSEYGMSYAAAWAKKQEPCPRAQ